MTTRFDLEQQIMACWSVVEDIETVAMAADDISTDELQNALIGLKSLYSLKFNRLFETFEGCLRENNL